MLWPALAAALWGVMYVVTQLAVADVPPISLGLARLLIGVGALLLVGRRLPLLRDRRLALLGVLVASTLMLQLWGTALSGAAAASLLTMTTPVFVALLAPILLAERTAPAQWAGILLALAGAAVVTGAGSRGSIQGDVLLIACAFTYGAFTVLGARLVRERGALEVTTAACLWAIPIMLPGVAAEALYGLRPHLEAATAVYVLYLGLGATALGWWAWYRGVDKLPAATAGAFFLIQPVVGVGLSIAVFGRPLSLGFFAGSLLIAAGMILASLRAEPAPVPQPQPSAAENTASR